EAFAERRVAADRKRTGREAVETVLAIDDRRTARRTARELDRGLHAFGARAREMHALERLGCALLELLREQSRQQRRIELHQARIIGCDEVGERLAHVGMIAADGEHTEARVEIEISRALDIPQVRSLSTHVTAVETNRA